MNSGTVNSAVVLLTEILSGNEGFQSRVMKRIVNVTEQNILLEKGRKQSKNHFNQCRSCRHTTSLIADFD